MLRRNGFPMPRRSDGDINKRARYSGEGSKHRDVVRLLNDKAIRIMKKQ